VPSAPEVGDGSLPPAPLGLVPGDEVVSAAGTAVVEDVQPRTVVLNLDGASVPVSFAGIEGTWKKAQT
jgi:hypothetical protein